MQIKSKAKKTYHFFERKNIKSKYTWLVLQVLDSNGSFVFLMYCKSACKYLLLKIQILAFSTALLIHR